MNQLNWEELLSNNIKCAVCRRNTDYQILYPERLNTTSVNLSGRRESEKVHLRIVKCKECGLVYSNPIFSEDYIIQLYKESKFIDETQVTNYLYDYIRQFKSVIPYLKDKDNLLEIGCGNGFFLKAALELGFKNVVGVELSKDDVDNAHPKIKDKIIIGAFDDKLFEDNTFDVVCALQVLDHITDPNTFLQNIYKVLKPGGLLLIINHNIHSFLTMILGERSPMFNVAHIYLFDKATIRTILKNNGYRVLYTKSLINRYTLEYSLKMFPLPGLLRRVAIEYVRRLRISNFQLRFPAGNIVTVAKKPNNIAMEYEEVNNENSINNSDTQ